MRRTWLRGRNNVQKRYHINISGYKLSLIMRLLTGFGTPRRWADAKIGVIWFHSSVDNQTDGVFACLVVIDGPYRGSIPRN